MAMKFGSALTRLGGKRGDVMGMVRITPVLEIDAHGAHVRRTKESWEDQKAGLFPHQGPDTLATRSEEMARGQWT